MNNRNPLFFKTELEKYQHTSSNSHYYGYSKYYNAEVFVKVFSSIRRFQNEYNALKILCPDEVLDHYECDGIYVLVLKYREYIDVQYATPKDYYQIGVMVATYHIKLQNKQLIGSQYNMQNPIDKLISEITNLKEHRKYGKLIAVYRQLSEFLPIAQHEYSKMDKILIHGDFGLRNTKLKNGELVLIDFERLKFDIPWNEFGKFFERECNMVQKKEFLNGYRTVRQLDEPSSLLKNIFDFITAAGIYKYTLKIKDDEFEAIADTILARLNRIFSKKKVLKSAILTLVGDAFGVPCTHYSAEDIIKVYGAKIDKMATKIRYFGAKPPKWRKGEVTDDSFQFYAILSQYINNPNVTRSDIAISLVSLDEKYCKPSTACGRFRTKNDMEYVSWFGRGNGGTNRSAALGLIAYLSCWSDSKLIDNVVKVVSLSHNTYESIGSSIFFVSLLRSALESGWEEKKTNIIKAFDVLFQYEHEIGNSDVSKTIARCVFMTPEKYISEFLNKKDSWGFLTIETVAMIANFYYNKECNLTTLIDLVNLGGDSDSSGALLGALIGGSDANLEPFMTLILDVFEENQNLITELFDLYFKKIAFYE